MNWLRDPTAEIEAVMRARRAPPPSLDGLTVGLFDIGKTRSDEFLNRVEQRMAERGIKTKRYAKPTNAKVAPKEVVDKVVDEADVVLIGLSD
ncbi:MAG: hypothetical protein OEW79_07705 [Betaproteobacteria bacterium]|jgi:hypothetical protein|nr:hypothetical protein [Betaproteobacteria bacterium]MDH4294069.1 hypothetical protein [Betaproteobacteria bacterium]MDH5342701.1 hypothetical protein [Betaproteobacteria bacterium]